MYSVEDLLISHGYKPPRNTAPLSSEGRRFEVAESGYNSDIHGKVDSHREHTGEYGERNWKSKESSEVELQGDFPSTSDRSCDGKLGMTCQPKPKRDLNYWRRRGQDFSVLLNYADVRGPQGAEYRVQSQGWDEAGWPRTKVAEGQEPRRTVADRKWQSLGTEEWRPAVGLGQQLLDGESERWAREQHYTKAEESSIHSRSKGKSQSLPRELLSESLQAMPIVGSQHIDATTFLGPYSKHNRCTSSEGLLAERYRPAVHASLLPRFGRPVKPPSYDAHQQTRNSSEMLAGDQGPRCRSRDKLSGWSKTGEMRQDSLTHQPAGSGLGPPGYIPPPSYKRPLNQKRDQKNYNEVSHFRLKEDLQPGTWEALKWYSRPRGGSWIDYQGNSVPCQRMTNPEYLYQHPGCVQYLPFNDPRLRHISGGQCGNSLTDSDKIRNIHREIPNAKVLEQSSHDSAFLPNEGPNTDVSKISVNENDSSSGWYGGLHSGNDNPITFDQNCNEYRTEVETAKFGQNGSADQEFSDSTTPLKNISPDALETTKPVKRKSETIFCLVSVPVHLQSNRKNSDQNNNETLPEAAEQSAPSTESMDHLQNQSLQITCSTSLELPPPLNGVTNRISIGKSSLKESVLTQSLQPSKHIGLRYSSSWPGDQYRDQETQTSSSEAPEGSSHSCLSLQAQDQGQPVSDTNVEGSLRTDCSSMYSFHAMKGQKTLQPSSNSAFSKTSTYSDWLNRSTVPMGRPTRKQKERDSLLVRNIEAVPALCNGEEAFGQFMLKPVGRRPWDAIEELESFNKELQDQFSQEASVDKCIEDIDAACRDLLECRTISSNTGYNKMPVRKLAKEIRNLSGESHKKATSAFRSKTAVGDPQYREGKSAFSRPVAKAVSFSDHLQNDVLIQSEGSSENYRTPGQMIKKTEPKWVSKPSVPVSLNKDVGFTELPSSNAQWAAKEPVHDVSTLSHPPEFEDICYSLQLTHESETWTPTNPVKSRPLDMDVISQDPCKAFSSDSKQESWFPTTETEETGKNRIPRFSGVRSVNVPKSHRLRGHGGPIWIVSNRLTEEKNSEGGNVTTSDWRSQLSLSEEHLESLHIKAKTNSMPEDLSTLYEVKCAKGIPENEPIEQRAARILGIEVPAESLFVVDQKGERELIKRLGKGAAFPSQEVPETSGNENQNLITQSKEVKDTLANEEELDVELTVPTGEDGLVTLTDGDSSGNCRDLDPALPDELLGDEIKMCVAISDDNEPQRDGDISRNHSGLSMTPEMLQVSNSTLSCQTDTETPERDREPHQAQSRHLILRSSEDDVADGTKMEEQLVSEDFSRTRRPSRGGTVTKREITLDLCYPPDSALMQDMEMPSFSDPYDPSHVERV
ncbi:junctional protein associated with coronary artery disease-like [Brienomyrus brachyistius]|uniref:junctional protein associated with coronary artery disease-like n=1 Tax=Brienomyrus brachyistius TaxID=42636 RepID=UPI0020B2C6FF|nr:junctional protein associated with coronary artery disease-like [Brienomyrus brachyistius]